MRYIQKLPKYLLSRCGVLNANLCTNSAVVRHFRKHVSLPLKKWNNPTKDIGDRLDGRVYHSMDELAGSLNE
jgi:hypothetical protein